MTSDLLKTARRSWAILLLGLLGTVALALHVNNAPPAYFAQVNVLIVPPEQQNSNVLNSSSQSLISTAGIVASIISGTDSGAQPVSDGVSLAGEGVTSGYAIRQPNAGGQWQYTFDQPVLDVQAIGQTPEATKANMAAALARIDHTLLSIQLQAGVSTQNLIRTSLSPSEPNFYQAKGSRTRALTATIAIGLMGTFLASATYERSTKRCNDKGRTCRGSPTPPGV